MASRQKPPISEPDDSSEKRRPKGKALTVAKVGRRGTGIPVEAYVTRLRPNAIGVSTPAGPEIHRLSSILGDTRSSSIEAQDHDAFIKWRQLGEKLRYVPVWPGLALIEHHDGEKTTPDDQERLLARIVSLKTELSRGGYRFALVVVAVSQIWHELEVKTSQIDAELIEVPKTYWELSTSSRIEFLTERFPYPRRFEHSQHHDSSIHERQSDGLWMREPQNIKPDAYEQYVRRSSRYTEDEIKSWADRLSDPDAPPSDID